jgi:hypothetical protein
LRFQTQEKFADIWLVLTIQTVIPLGLCYLTFVCQNKLGNHCNWHKSFKELRLRKVQHYRSSLKEEKPLQFLIPLTLLPKNHNLFCEGKEGLKKSGERKGKSVTTSL